MWFISILVFSYLSLSRELHVENIIEGKFLQRSAKRNMLYLIQFFQYYMNAVFHHIEFIFIHIIYLPGKNWTTLRSNAALFRTTSVAEINRPLDDERENKQERCCMLSWQMKVSWSDSAALFTMLETILNEVFLLQPRAENRTKSILCVDERSWDYQLYDNLFHSYLCIYFHVM